MPTPAPPPVGPAPASAFDLPAVKPIDLGFDPTEKDSLPFDLPEGGLAMPLDGPPSEPADGFALGPPGGAPAEQEPVDREAAAGAEGPAPESGEEAFSDPAGIMDFGQPVAMPRRPEDDLPDVEPDVFRIPCPSGHVVTVTRDLLGKTAICSLCRERFPLRYEKSLEYREKTARQQERQEKNVGQVWLAWSIAVAMAVLIGVIVLVFAFSGH
jgi:hypothetical protein